MVFNIAFSEKFPYELGNVPKSVLKACMRWQKQVRNHEKLPNRVDPPQIKKLNDYKDFWRARISDDYRLVYHFNAQENLVTMLMIDHRNKIYERLGMGVDGRPGIRIVAQAEELLEKKPSPEEIGRAEIALSSNEVYFRNPEPGRALPSQLNVDILKELNVPDRFSSILCQLQTEDDLLNAHDIPDEVKERIMYYYWPSNVEEVMQKPVRIAAQPADLEDAADGKRPLESFLLKLD
jgi:mRNA-degrading endonuclease RelE of RelBE toxin-antitoxin system